jgi:hypothetical protein
VLSPSARTALIAEQPGALGNLDGLPGNVRHLANSAVLQRELETDLDPAFSRRERADHLRAGSSAADRRAMLLVVRRELAAGPDRRLLTLDLGGAGCAVIAMGDVDASRDVAIVVPGLGQDVTGDLDTVDRNAQHLRDAAMQLEKLRGQAEGVASVAWIGYRTPSLVDVASSRRAKAGGQRLASFASGLDSSREIERLLAAPPPALHLTLVGHSYGSLAVGFAMRTSAPADDVVLAGSPGVGVRSAVALTGKRGNVFVAEARGDAVADLHWFGADPSRRAFGALQLQTDGGIDALTGSALTPSRGHSQYFRVGSESLRNIAAVTIGAPHLATYGDMSSSGDHVLDIWR